MKTTANQTDHFEYSVSTEEGIETIVSSHAFTSSFNDETLQQLFNQTLMAIQTHGFLDTDNLAKTRYFIGLLIKRKESSRVIAEHYCRNATLVVNERGEIQLEEPTFPITVKPKSVPTDSIVILVFANSSDSATAAKLPEFAGKIMGDFETRLKKQRRPRAQSFSHPPPGTTIFSPPHVRTRRNTGGSLCEELIQAQTKIHGKR